MSDDACTSRGVYPAMSHPTADPASLVLAACFAGFAAPDPARARVLEIGCGTGHHLLPLAMRWPEAGFTGIDANEDAVRRARELANDAGLDGRVDFQACTLEDFDADGKHYDFIIAHGFFSWVPDAVKRDLLAFCARHLASNGLAVVSFNVEAGWHARTEVVRRVRAIQQAGDGLDVIAALHLLKSVSQDAAETAIIDDMLAKEAVLHFDDFGPVNDPWPLDAFVAEAEAAGLRWLGESRISDNRPPGWTVEDEAAASAVRGSLAPVDFHQWIDERAGRTFRSALLCRNDAPVAGKMRATAVLDFALRPATPTPLEHSDIARRIHQALLTDWPSAVPGHVLVDRLSDLAPPEIARAVCEMLLGGQLWARCDIIKIPRRIPERPTLDPLKLACARRRLPVVDAWHVPCLFPDAQYSVLELIDGSHTLDELQAKAAVISPRLDFKNWLAHLHERGMFAG